MARKLQHIRDIDQLRSSILLPKKVASLPNTLHEADRKRMCSLFYTIQAWDLCNNWDSYWGYYALSDE
ncbi:MAG: hypothetical protein AAFR87_15265 [Bacteroidota bacterium]